MQPPEPPDSPAPSRSDRWLDSPPPALVPYAVSASDDGTNDDVIVAALTDTGDHHQPRARLWTSIAVVALSLATIIVLSIVMRVATVWALDPSLNFRQLLEVDRLKDAFRSRLGLFLLVVVPQLGLAIPAVIAALLSPQPFRERLGLTRGRWPLWTWVAAAAATPLVGLISSVFFSLFLNESDSLREMGEIFRLHGQGGFLLPLALMIGATPAICEELLFRGYVQTRLTQAFRPGVGILLASLLFAIFHMDYVHALAVLPLGLFLGSVSWLSGSLFPAMLGHFVNNAISVVLMSFASEGEEMTLSMPGVFAFLTIVACGFLGILAVVAATVRYGSPSPSGLGRPANSAS